MYIHACVYIYIYACICILYIYIYISLSLYIYIYIYGPHAAPRRGMCIQVQKAPNVPLPYGQLLY